MSEDIAISEDLIEESVDEELQEKNGKSMRTSVLAILNVNEFLYAHNLKYERMIIPRLYLI